MLFDAYVVVDWSAASKRKQGADSVWISFGQWEGTDLRRQPSRNPSTRAQAAAALTAGLAALVAQGKRVLVGFDFPYGYPRGFATALRSLEYPPAADSGDWALIWHRLAASLRDQPDNANNRFEAAGAINACLGGQSGPFWGCPVGREVSCLKPTSPSFPFATAGHSTLARYRETEGRLRADGKQVQETWKLFGNGSVGSQALLGIPRVAALRWATDLGPVSAVWPFETGFTRGPGVGRRPFILHAEIWPGLGPSPGQGEGVKDQLQVEGLVEFLANKDAAGELEVLFDAPADLNDSAIEACTHEEGWILGA